MDDYTIEAALHVSGPRLTAEQLGTLVLEVSHLLAEWGITVQSGGKVTPVYVTEGSGSDGQA